MSVDDSKLKLPLINTRYYDEQDNLLSKIKIDESTQLFETFEGEIFEKLDFNNKSLSRFISSNNYEFIDDQTTSCIHFQAEEWNSKKLKEYYNMEKKTFNNEINEKVIDILNFQKNKCKDSREMYIVKNKRYFMFYYNAPYFYDADTTSTSFTSSEIEKVIGTLNELVKLEQHSDEKDNFMIYMIYILRRYEKNLENRGYKLNNTIVDEKTLQLIEKCVLENRATEATTNINFKLKIISENPIFLFNEKEKVKNKILSLK